MLQRSTYSFLFASLIICLHVGQLSALVGFDEDEESKNIFDPNNREWNSGEIPPEPTAADDTGSGVTYDPSEGSPYVKILDSDNDAEIFQQHYCSMIEIPLSNTGIEVNIYNIRNSKGIMLSTTMLETCSDILNFECPPNAAFCEKINLEDESDLEMEEAACHHNLAYLYVSAQDPSEDVEFEVIVTPLDHTQCNTASNQGTTNNQQSGDFSNDSGFEDSDEGTDNLEEWEYCEPFIRADTCNPNPNDCSSKCVWTSCSVNTTGTVNEISGYCVPRNTSKDEITELCSFDEEFSTVPAEDRIITTQTCPTNSQSGNGQTTTDKTADNQTSGDQTSDDQANLGQTGGLQTAASDITPHPTVLHYVGMVFFITFTLFICLICFYRRQFRKHGVGPFNAPTWCPRFVFPRHREAESAFAPIQLSETSYEYKPPMLEL